MTNHPLVLIFIVQHPESTIRTIAQGVGLTERATLAIMHDLDEERVIERHRDGRRNTYVVRYERLLGMSVQTRSLNVAATVVVGALVDISPEGPRTTRRRHVPSEEDCGPRIGSWAFFTNHMQLLGAIARDSTMTVRDLAMETHITERAAMQILNQLEAEDIIVRRREGRRNSYTIDVAAFRAFRGWHYEGWSMPKQLIDVAINGIMAMSRRPR